MGVARTLRLVRAAEQSTAVAGWTGPGPDIASPWTVGQLTSVVWADILGSDLPIMTRAEAMTIPAVARARNLLCTTIAGAPLRTYRGPDQLEPGATWTYRGDGPWSPWHRMAWTVDDLLFGGWSLWAVGRDGEGAVVDASRVPPELWTWGDDKRTILVADQEVDARSVVLIPGANEGILSFGSRALRAAALLERSYADQATNPVPAIELHQLSGDQLDTVEAQALVREWVNSIRGGGVAYTNSAVEARDHSASTEQLLIEGRNAAAVDVARMTGIPASLLDATNAGASLTYETIAGRNAEFVDYGLAGYMGPIAARLSMDDVVPRGQRVAFDLSDLTAPTPAPTGPTLRD